MTVAVAGAGSWGTALALQLARNGHRVHLWSHDPGAVDAMARDRENRRYLPGFPFSPRLEPLADLGRAAEDAALVMVVVPSHAYGETLRRLAAVAPAGLRLAWATKGLEAGGGRFLHEVNAQILGAGVPSAIVSGPSFAKEVARAAPTAITVAAADPAHARFVAGLLHGPNFRAYTSEDVVGVEIGGAVKNVLAVATGISDGLGFGANARAALITRGLTEMVRLGESVGAQRATLMGLSGLGDLVLTCTDDQSRNRRFGLAIGRGQAPADAQREIGQVVEGVRTVVEVQRLAARQRVEMPITEQVYRVLREGLELESAVRNLLERALKPERG